MIHFKGALTPENYARALRASGRGLRVVACGLALAGLIGLTSAHLDRPVTWGMPLFLVLFGILLLLSPRMTVRRAFATDRLLGEPFAGDADEQGMRIEPAHGRVDLPWSLMHKVVLSPGMVVVYQSASLFRILPRELFADDESWQSFRRLATAAIPAAGPSRFPIRMFVLWIAIVVAVMILWFLFNRG